MQHQIYIAFGSERNVLMKFLHLIHTIQPKIYNDDTFFSRTIGTCLPEVFIHSTDYVYTQKCVSPNFSTLNSIAFFGLAIKTTR